MAAAGAQLHSVIAHKQLAQLLAGQFCPAASKADQGKTGDMLPVLLQPSQETLRTRLDCDEAPAALWLLLLLCTASG